jgi:hypothetical protein
MYPVSSFDVPKPIAIRTREYLFSHSARARIR